MPYYDPTYNDSATTIGKAYNALNAHMIWSICAIVLAVIGGIVLYFTVFNKKNEGKYKGFMSVLYDLVHFRFFVIEDIVKVLYIISVIGITLLSFNYIGNWQFLVYLIGGNLSARLSFELIMLFMGLCSDVRDISKKNKKKD